MSARRLFVPPYRSWKTLGAALLVLGCGVAPFQPSPQPPPDSLTLRIVGQSYGWKVQYPGPDGRFDTTDDAISGPEFCLPVGIPVVLEVTSRDYLYLLKIPRFDIKVMAVPDMVMTAEVRIEIPTHGELSGDPMCGFQHGELSGRATVVPWEDFTRWRRSLPPPRRG